MAVREKRAIFAGKQKMTMKVTILGSGTSQGVPVIGCRCATCRSTDERDKRLRCAAMLEAGETRVLIDAGPDFRQQMLREGVGDARAILLTHEHKDHVGGLDDVRAFNYVKGGPVDVYGNRRTLEAVRRDYAYAFAAKRYPGVPEMRLHEVGDIPFYIDGLEVVPVPVLHHRLEVLGYRVGGFAYVTDANFVPPASMRRLEGVECLVINALRRTPHLSHFSLEEALEVARRVGARRTFVTHVGHEMGLHAEVSRVLPPGVELARDGLSFEA